MTQSDRLEQLFPSYDLAKVFEGCHAAPDVRMVAGISAEALARNLGEASAAGLIENPESAEYALAELQRYFANDPACTINQRSAEIFALFLRHELGG